LDAPLSILTLLLGNRRPDWVPAALVGAGLVLLGSWFINLHLRTYRRQRTGASGEEAESAYSRRQFRRRMQASGLIIVIGLLLPIGDSLIAWPAGEAGLIAWAVYWLFVLGLTGWVMLLAVGDLAATRTHAQSALNRLQQRQRELQAEADRLRGSTRPPGGSAQNR
jgi:hypothetical protein